MPWFDCRGHVVFHVYTEAENIEEAKKKFDEAFAAMGSDLYQLSAHGFDIGRNGDVYMSESPIRGNVEPGSVILSNDQRD